MQAGGKKEPKKGFSLPTRMAPALSFGSSSGDAASGQRGGAIWMDNKAVNKCFECNVSFTLFNRKHHCRACGRIFCARCSSQRALVEGVEGAQRVCDHCYIEADREVSSVPNAAAVRAPSSSASPAVPECGSARFGQAGLAAGSPDPLCRASTDKGAVAGAGREDSAESIPLELAAKYTYFKEGQDDLDNGGADARANTQCPGTAREDETGEDTGLHDENLGAVAWNRVLGGKADKREGQDEVQDQSVPERRKSEDDATMPGAEEGHTVRGQIKRPTGPSVSDEGPPRGWGDEETERNRGLLQVGCMPSEDAQTRQGGAPIELARLHDEEVRRQASAQRRAHNFKCLCSVAQRHLSSLLVFLRQSEGLDQAWQPVLQVVGHATTVK